MNSKALKQLLANSIEAGIAQHQTAIAKNNAKEQNGLAKLSQTLGGQDPALTGAGGNLSAGSATTEVPNLARAEKRPGEGNLEKWTKLKAGPLASDFSKDKKAKKNNTRAEYESSKVEKGALMDSLTKPGLQGKAPSLMGKVKSGVSTGIVNAKQKLGIGRNEFGKGALPDVEKTMSDSGGAGARAAVKASGSPINKDEMDAGNNCPMCSGPAEPLGVLGNTLHLLCRNCGSHSTTIVEENTERKENAGPTVAKGEKNWAKMTPAEKDESNKRTSKEDKAVYDADLKDRISSKPFKVAVNKSEPLATMRTTKAKGISGLPAPKSKMVVKAEFKTPSQAEYPKAEGKYQANDEISDAPHTNWSKVNSSLVGKKIPSVNKGIRRIAKEEISPIKEVPMTRLVTAEKVNGAKGIGDEKVPAAIKTDGSGDITKGKSLEKGSLPMIPGKGVANKNKYLGYLSSLKFSPNTAYANPTGAKTVQTLNAPEPQVLHPSDKVAKGALVDHIKAASAKAGVNVKDVLGYKPPKPPKTLQVAKPAPTPNFNKSSIPMVGVAREAAIKTGKPVIPGRPMVTKLTGGVQGQIAAQKKPLIPMVNAGVVAKAMVDGEWQPNGQAESTHQKILKQHGAKALKEAVKNIQDKKKVTKAEWGNTGKSWAGIKVNPANKPGVIRHDGGTSPSNPPTKVTKAESPAAKPITKSPSSGPAGKVSTPKPTSNLAPRAPKL